MGYRNYDTANGLLVDPLGNGDFTTIAGALAVVTTGQTIFLRPGNYSESNTISTSCNIVGMTGDGYGNVKVTGTFTVTAAITVYLSNLELTTPATTYFLAVTGSAASVVYLTNCYLNCSVATGIHYTSSSASSSIIINDCDGNLGTTGIGIFTHTSAGGLTMYYSEILNSGASTTANTASAGTIGFFYSRILNPITTSSTNTSSFAFCVLDCTSINTTPLTSGGSGNCTCLYVYFSGGSASGISVSNTTTMSSCVVSSSNTDAMTGTGTINSIGTLFPGTSHLSNVTTQAGGAASGLTQGSAPSTGFVGEQIRSQVGSISLTSATPKNITSISLTPGIWDVSAVLSVANSAANMGATIIGISTNTGSFTGCVEGDSQLTFNNLIASNDWTNIPSSIPSFRVTLSSSTTYYLVAQANFNSGTTTGSGRISGTRVG